MPSPDVTTKLQSKTKNTLIFRLTSEESLFFKKSGKKSCRKPASAKAEEKYCTCNYGGEVEKCTTEGYAVRPTFGGAKPQTIVSNGRLVLDRIIYSLL